MILLSFNHDFELATADDCFHYPDGLVGEIQYGPLFDMGLKKVTEMVGFQRLSPLDLRQRCRLITIALSRGIGQIV